MTNELKKRLIHSVCLELFVDRVQGAGYRVQGAGCRVQDAGCRVLGSGCRVQGAGCRVQGSGCSRVEGRACVD